MWKYHCVSNLERLNSKEEHRGFTDSNNVVPNIVSTSPVVYANILQRNTAFLITSTLINVWTLNPW